MTAPVISVRSRPALVAVCLAVNVICTLPVFLTGAMAVQLRADLGFGVAALGVAVALNRAAAIVAAPMLGRAADRLGPMTSMRIATVAAMLAALGIATLVDRWGSLVAFLAAAGVTTSLGQSAANLALTRVVPTERRGLAFGLKQSAMPLAALLAGLAVPTVAVTIGWRWAFFGVVAIAAIVAIVIPRGAGGGGSGGFANRIDRPQPFIVLAVGMLFAMAATASLGAFIVDSAASDGIDPGLAGLWLTIGSAAAIAVRLGAGFAADRRTAHDLDGVIALALLGIPGFAMLSLDIVPLQFVGLLLAFGFGWGFNGLFWLAVMNVSEGTPGRATGLIMPGTLLGGLTGPMAFGWIADHWGYAVGWRVAALWMLIAVVVLETGRRMLVAGDGTRRPSVG